jgi:inosose dehydratase
MLTPPFYRQRRYVRRRVLFAHIVVCECQRILNQKFHFGCAAITWDGDDARAITDIAALGYRGIQLRANILETYGARPQALRDLLLANRLEFVAMSSGSLTLNQSSDADQLAKHTRHAQFVRDAGGHYLQIIDSARPKTSAPTHASIKLLGNLITEIGKRTSDLGVQLGYHNHMDSVGESPAEIAHLLDATDSRYVKLELDIAHYFQGGGDPARAIRQYKDRLLFLHIKDVEPLKPSAGKDARHSYRFVELGRGKVNLSATFAALKEIKFRGWAIVELDSVPDNARTPKESAAISKQYIIEQLRLKI